MRLGVSLAQAGRCADPAAIRSAALAAEQVGFSSVWVADRVPSPTGGRAEPPTEIVDALDPLNVLTFAAAVTTRVRLGTSVLVTPWYRPAMLTRSLRSLDVLSDGRLTIGLGLGWALDDATALGIPGQELARRLDDALDVMGAAWAPPGDGRDPDAPTRARPPVLLAGDAPDALDRVARRADGWNPAGLPIDRLGPMWATVRERAAAHRRDPEALELVVRADVDITDAPVDGDRPPYHGTVEQVAADIADTRRAGAHEVILGLRGDPCLDQALDLYARLAETLDVVAPV